ncbi:porin [Halomonas sp. EGI 63088]|uniref:Porin n=1 Tax=Halomonas flagellata TaxID=2920385 RepID=A0ABS9RU87_9GAMM|nr:porin [Halomonas flagellata]MCH4563407.1 porin [Halomonas flagellata]
MKKTLLATAIAGALGASAAAQAATVYDQDGTRLDLYGRIALGVQGGGEEVNEAGEKINGSEFVDVFSRFGLRGSQQLSSDLTAFGNFELRPQLDEVNRDGQQVRNSFLGLRSNTLGTLQAGNFDSFYLNTVGAPFDVYLNRGYEFTGGSHQARGDSVGYITPNLEGFQVFLMGKHFSGNGNEAGSEGSNSSKINTAGGAVYETGPLRLALGYAEDRESTGGIGENIYGGTASFEFVPGFSGRLGYEYQAELEDKIGVGMTYAVADWAFNLDYYRIESQGDFKAAQEAEGLSTSRNSWAAGAYYKVSSNFDIFAEVHESDQGTIIDSDTTGSDFADNLSDVRDNVYWLTGARYHF